MRWAARFLLLAPLACARVSTDYTPNKAEFKTGTSPVTELPTVAYEGDVEALARAGGEIVGTLSADGNERADQSDLELEVRKRAGRLGATHIVFVSAHTEGHQRPSTYRTSCTKLASDSATCVTRERFGRMVQTEHAQYILFRVPIEKWSELPSSLSVSNSLVVTQSAEPEPTPARLAEPTASNSEEDSSTTFREALGLDSDLPPNLRSASELERENAAIDRKAAERAKTIREQCYARAQKEFEDVNVTVEVATDSESEISPEVRKQRARDKAIQSYRSCVDTESRTQ